MPSLDLEVRTQLNLALAEAAAQNALRIFGRAGDEIATGFGGRISRALGGFTTRPAQDELRRLQAEYAKLADAEKAASDLAVRRASEVETALRRKVALAESDTATAVESARAERALVDTRRAHEQALRRQETAIVATQAAHDRLGGAAELAGTKAETATRAFNFLGVGAVAATGIAMVETTKQAADFQQGLERLSTVTQDSAQNIKIVHDGILQLAGQVGYAVPELTKAMLGVEKAGFRGADGVKVLTAAAQFASEENADLQETINGVTTSMHDFHIPVERAADVTSKLNVAVGLSKVSAQEFGGSLHSIEPIASALGDNLNDVYAAVATLTQSGMSADQATQNLAHSFSSLAKPTQQMRDEMGALGLDWRDIQQHLGDRGIVQTAELLHNAVTTKLGPSGQVMLDTWYKSQSAADSAQQMLAAMPPQVRAVADSIDNGNLSYAEFRKTRGGLAVEQANEINQWKAVEDKLKGFNNTLKSGQGDVQGEIQALATLVGGQDNLRTILQLTGENQQRANDNLKQLSQTHADAAGKTVGFTASQETYNAKMKDAKAAFEATRIEIGELFLPTMTHVLDVTKDVGQVLATHPGILRGVADGVGVLGGAWLGFKAINIAESILAPIATGLGGIIAGEEGATAAASGLKTAMAGLGGIGLVGGAAAIAANSQSDAMKAAGMKTPEEVGQQQGTWAEAKYLFHQTFWADGGAVNGPGPKGVDSVAAWLAPGEHVLTARDVDAMGGHSNVHAFRNALHRDMGGPIGPDVQAAASMTGTAYSQGSRTDCSGMVARVINAAMGIPGGGLMSTKNAEQWLAARGFRPGVGGPGSISVGWYDHGPNPNDGHMAMTLSNGMPAESGGSHGNFMIGGGAAGATASEFDHHMFLPASALYGEGAAAMGGGFGGGSSGGGAGGFGGMGGFGGGGMMPAGATAGTGPMGQPGYYTPDQTRVAGAQERLRHLDEEIANAERRKGEMKAGAKQSEKDRLDEDIRHLNEERTNAVARLEEAQRGTFHESRGGRGAGAMGGMPELSDDFGLSGGLPGMAKWLVSWVGSMGLAAAFGGSGFGGSDGAALPSLAGFGGGMPPIGGGGFGGDMPSLTSADSGAPSGAPGGSAVSTAAAVTPTPSAPPSAAAPTGRQMPSPAASSGAGWFGDSTGYAAPPTPAAAPAPGMSPLVPSWARPFGTPDQLFPGRSNSTSPPNVGSMISPGYTGTAHDWLPLFGDPIHRATGGPSGTDTIPAWLSPGEFTAQKSAVDKYGLPFMHAVNEGRVDPTSVRYFGIGGPVDEPAPAVPAAAVSTPKPPTPPPTPAPAPTSAPAAGESPTGTGNKQPGESVSMPFNSGQSSPGFGISGGAGGAAAGMFPGGGLAFALAGRTVGYGAQLAGIGTEAAIQTLLPNDSPLANFSGTLPGKLLGAVAGARPAGKNMAGQQTPPQLTKDQVDTDKSKWGSSGRGEAPLVGEMHNYGVNNGDDVASALTRATYTSYSAGRTR